MANDLVSRILSLASASSLINYRWIDDEGVRYPARPAYIKGMALAYGRVFCKLGNRHPAAIEMAKQRTNDPSTDALAFYQTKFSQAGMRNDADGADTLRHLFVLLVGLGMWESSGFHCKGKYAKQDFNKAESAEAGLFQSSYDMTTNCKKIMLDLIAEYSARPSGFVEVFSQDIVCPPEDWKSWGDPHHPGYAFQKLSKDCPAFAAEFAGVGLRHCCLNWGPIKHKKNVEIIPDCDVLFKGVESLIAGMPGACSQLL